MRSRSSFTALTRICRQKRSMACGVWRFCSSQSSMLMRSRSLRRCARGGWPGARGRCRLCRGGRGNAGAKGAGEMERGREAAAPQDREAAAGLQKIKLRRSGCGRGRSTGCRSPAGCRSSAAARAGNCRPSRRRCRCRPHRAKCMTSHGRRERPRLEQFDVETGAASAAAADKPASPPPAMSTLAILMSVCHGRSPRQKVRRRHSAGYSGGAADEIASWAAPRPFAGAADFRRRSDCARLPGLQTTACLRARLGKWRRISDSLLSHDR